MIHIENDTDLALIAEAQHKMNGRLEISTREGMNRVRFCIDNNSRVILCQSNLQVWDAFFNFCRFVCASKNEDQWKNHFKGQAEIHHYWTKIYPKINRTP